MWPLSRQRPGQHQAPVQAVDFEEEEKETRKERKERERQLERGRGGGVSEVNNSWCRLGLISLDKLRSNRDSHAVLLLLDSLVASKPANVLLIRVIHLIISRKQDL